MPPGFLLPCLISPSNWCDYSFLNCRCEGDWIDGDKYKQKRWAAKFVDVMRAGADSVALKVLNPKAPKFLLAPCGFTRYNDEYDVVCCFFLYLQIPHCRPGHKRKPGCLWVGLEMYESHSKTCPICICSHNLLSIFLFGCIRSALYLTLPSSAVCNGACRLYPCRLDLGRWLGFDPSFGRHFA